MVWPLNYKKGVLMFTFLSLNKIALITIFSICAFAGIYAADAQDSNAVARDGRGGFDRDGERDRDDRGRDDRGGDARDSRAVARDDRGGGDASRFQDQNRYRGGYGGVYGGGYGGAVIYPQNPQYPYEAFPDDAQFNNIYEQNAHPPR